MAYYNIINNYQFSNFERSMQYFLSSFCRSDYACLCHQSILTAQLSIFFIKYYNWGFTLKVYNHILSKDVEGKMLLLLLDSNISLSFSNHFVFLNFEDVVIRRICLIYQLNIWNITMIPVSRFYIDI